MKLHELLNSTYEWDELSHENHNLYTTHFEDVDVHISKWMGAWDVEFTRGGSHEMTGEGDAIKIFATVLDIIKEFVAQEKPEFITFSAKTDETSRVKFYKRIAKKIEAMGFKDISDQDDFSEFGKQIEHLMKRDTGSKQFLLIKK